MFFAGWILMIGVVLFGLIVLVESADTSSWIRDGNCVTVATNDNRFFGPDHTYVNTYCDKE